MTVFRRFRPGILVAIDFCEVSAVASVPSVLAELRRWSTEATIFMSYKVDKGSWCGNTDSVSIGSLLRTAIVSDPTPTSSKTGWSVSAAIRALQPAECVTMTMAVSSS